MAKRKTYNGKDISVTFDLQRCVHARNCWLKLPAVFDPSRRPWVLPDAAPAEEVAAMIRSCPSGALQFERHDSGVEETPSGTNIAQIRENGPLVVMGDIHIGEEQMPRATLCRCGLSKNKPFCDNSHIKGGFEATGECHKTDKDSADGIGGPLVLTENANGSIKVTGNLEVIGGSGKKIASTAAARLCRCGHSKMKPFCDGSHKAAGFTTED